MTLSFRQVHLVGNRLPVRSSQRPPIRQGETVQFRAMRPLCAARCCLIHRRHATGTQCGRAATYVASHRGNATGGASTDTGQPSDSTTHSHHSDGAFQRSSRHSSDHQQPDRRSPA